MFAWNDSRQNRSSNYDGIIRILTEGAFDAQLLFLVVVQRERALQRNE